MPKYREARIAKGLKQADVSAALRPFGEYVPVPVISRYETGQSLPTPRQHEIMCKVLDSEELLSEQDVEFSFIRRVNPPVGPGTSIHHRGVRQDAVPGNHQLRGPAAERRYQ